MMGYYGGYGMWELGGGFWMVLFGVVWLVVGILLAIWLWQNINKK